MVSCIYLEEIRYYIRQISQVYWCVGTFHLINSKWQTFPCCLATTAISFCFYLILCLICILYCQYHGLLCTSDLLFGLTCRSCFFCVCLFVFLFILMSLALAVCFVFVISMCFIILLFTFHFGIIVLLFRKQSLSWYKNIYFTEKPLPKEHITLSVKDSNLARRAELTLLSK